jgi:ubiquinone/menaquinone biosynthesis C-methylase UbiE
MMRNVHEETVSGFGDEWSRFDQSGLSAEERRMLFEKYFHIFPWEKLPADARGIDVGCGSGRWAIEVAGRVHELNCIDASSEALGVAKINLGRFSNCTFHIASAEEIPLPVASMDFGYSLGVLHHIPDTLAGLKGCTSRLKKGAPFLLYLYYRFDNRSAWFVALWRLSDFGRRLISIMPHALRAFCCKIIAALVYFPLARTAKVLSLMGFDVSQFPLSGYRDTSFYSMSTDALDRFGTRLEKRFTRPEMKQMMEAASLENIRFSEEFPFWCAVGFKK